MAKEERVELLQLFHSHQKSVYETFQAMDEPPVDSFKKISWEKVVQIGDAISRQATIVGMLWSGEPPEAEEIEENMAAYVNDLNGLVLLSFGSTIGAGPTLWSCIRNSVKKVLDTSFMIMKESVDSHGACSENDRTIPQLVGQVWAACLDLEKTPSSNIVAIGRAMTKIAVSLKDVIRELNELKTDENVVDKNNENADDKNNKNDNDDNNSSCGADLGNDLSPEEMKVAKASIVVVSEILAMIKEIIRSITALIKRPEINGFVDSLEKVLKGCEVIGLEIDELGACLYPPQEVTAMRALLGKISEAIVGIERDMASLGGASEPFVRACGGLKDSIVALNAELDRSEE